MKCYLKKKHFYKHPGEICTEFLRFVFEILKIEFKIVVNVKYKHTHAHKHTCMYVSGIINAYNMT